MEKIGRFRFFNHYAFCSGWLSGSFSLFTDTTLRARPEALSARSEILLFRCLFLFHHSLKVTSADIQTQVRKVVHVDYRVEVLVQSGDLVIKLTNLLEVIPEDRSDYLKLVLDALKDRRLRLLW